MGVSFRKKPVDSEDCGWAEGAAQESGRVGVDPMDVAGPNVLGVEADLQR
jgi:hypothetical protein